MRFALDSLALLAVSLILLIVDSTCGNAATITIRPVKLDGVTVRLNARVSIRRAADIRNRAIRSGAVIRRQRSGNLTIEITDPNVRSVNLRVEAPRALSATLENVLVTNQTVSVTLPDPPAMAFRCYHYLDCQGRWIQICVPEAAPAIPPATWETQKSPAAIDQCRLWTDASGNRQAEAQLIAVDQHRAYFRRPDGREASTLLDNLSTDDRRLVSAWQTHVTREKHLIASGS